MSCSFKKKRERLFKSKLSYSLGQQTSNIFGLPTPLFRSCFKRFLSVTAFKIFMLRDAIKLYWRTQTTNYWRQWKNISSYVSFNETRISASTLLLPRTVSFSAVTQSIFQKKISVNNVFWNICVRSILIFLLHCS